MKTGAVIAAFTDLPGALRACFWFVIAGGLFVIMLAIVRNISEELDMLLVVFWRSFFGVMLMLPWLARRGINALHTRRFGVHVVRAGLNYISLYVWLVAATLMPLADLTAIGFTRPIIASLMAVVFLGEVMRARRWAATFVGFIGAMIVIRPGFADPNPGLVYIAIGVLGASVMSIIVKYLSRTDAPDTTTMYLVGIMTPVTFIVALFVWQWPSAHHWGWLIAIAALSTYSQRALARAYAAADATVVVSFDFLRLPIAAAIGFAVFSEFPDLWVWIGAAVICASSIYIARRESAVERLHKKASGQ